jgi:hypothetical protein
VISFRFHLVSLVAVFLALGTGVIAGTTVLNRGIVAQLERTTQDLQDQRERDEAELGELNTYVDATLGHLLSGRLTGQEALLITQEGTDEQAIENVRLALEDADATVVALLSVGRRMALPTQEDREALAQTIGAEDVSDPVELKLLAAEALAGRLSLGPLESDVLPELIREEFLLNQGPGLGEQGLQQLSEADLVVVVGGGTEQPALLPDRFLVPLVSSLAENEDAQAVAAAESLDTSYEFVTLLRSDQEASANLVTQDNVDQLVGEVGLVLGVEQLMVLGEPGHYGEKDGAVSLLPEPPSA